MPTLTAAGLWTPVPTSLPHPVGLGMSAMLGPKFTDGIRLPSGLAQVSLGGGTCALGLVTEIVFYIFAWRNPNRVRENLPTGQSGLPAP
ncbi:hypothetical protein IQ26_05231 [Mesorhizobium tianshanense]|uniref:Uncharacterized protein n=1 Tax=Mesorhizobium tianshanense TaxID=39844 RepID=A0A562N8B3_9HYPH|nr:hypothetical protein IQ26_05231 [Mesorhizobium tianshanense]